MSAGPRFPDDAEENIFPDNEFLEYLVSRYDAETSDPTPERVDMELVRRVERGIPSSAVQMHREQGYQGFWHAHVYRAKPLLTPHFIVNILGMQSEWKSAGRGDGVGGGGVGTGGPTSTCISTSPRPSSSQSQSKSLPAEQSPGSLGRPASPRHGSVLSPACAVPKTVDPATAAPTSGVADPEPLNLTTARAKRRSADHKGEFRYTTRFSHRAPARPHDRGDQQVMFSVLPCIHELTSAHDSHNIVVSDD